MRPPSIVLKKITVFTVNDYISKWPTMIYPFPLKTAARIALMEFIHFPQAYSLLGPLYKAIMGAIYDPGAVPLSE